ncbi:MAG TPA: tRNA lysidine(34) synthetase TilS [Candidatus Saccharimonadales bacterium]|nr:tRNA lysidine(34) synthetase TilS [Candidatus Saccharimonadales bacterium]
MHIEIEPGTYVLAVSGGVDSMVLLDVLARCPGLQLIVAHFDHGIRPDSAEDRQLVQTTAARHGLPFVYEEGRLGAGASEATARAARYAFLERVRRQYAAKAIITAHQQDDVLETAILNLLRGTGRRGLTALASSGYLLRPLVDIPKSDLRAYAVEQQLQWREDSTNTDDSYARNYIRHHILPRFDAADRRRLLGIIAHMRDVNKELDKELAGLLDCRPSKARLDRRQFIMLPHDVAKELLAAWLRANDVRSFNAATLERVVVAAKTLPAGARVDAIGGATLRVGKEELALALQER